MWARVRGSRDARGMGTNSRNIWKVKLRGLAVGLDKIRWGLGKKERLRESRMSPKFQV